MHADRGLRSFFGASAPTENFIARYAGGVRGTLLSACICVNLRLNILPFFSAIVLPAVIAAAQTGIAPIMASQTTA
jgi:hypothetical protein